MSDFKKETLKNIAILVEEEDRDRVYHLLSLAFDLGFSLGKNESLRNFEDTLEECFQKLR